MQCSTAQVRDARGDLQKGAAGYPKPRHAPPLDRRADHTENWSSIGAEINGDVYEGLLAKSGEVGTLIGTNLH